MDSFTRRPGDPYPYREMPSGKWFWSIPGNPVKHGPFSTLNEAADDIIIYNAFRADRIIAIARVCHEVNRAFCIYLGDDSQLSWEEASFEIKQSAIRGVEFHVNNPDAGDSASHDDWMRGKIAVGYVFGAVKDDVAKTHPSLIPFTDLPPAEQMKDTFFRSTVHRLWTLGA